MSAGHIVTGDELKESAVLEADAVVVGSGSGGAWVAHELVRAGLKVVLLEEGGYHTRREFDLTEARAFPNLYQELGSRTTDDLSITLLQGRSVGGGTTVNWCASFRTPDRIFAHWQKHHGLEALSKESLAPHWDAIEKRLHIAEWPLELVNANNKVLWDGLGALGYERGLIRRNVNNCLNIGYCGMGCPVDAKQSMLVTVIPDAVERGLDVYANVSVRRIVWEGRTASGVEADILDPATNKPTGRTLGVKARVVIASGGAINTPALLLRSQLDGRGLVGRRTWLHPVVVTLAEFEHDINAFSGAPQSVYSHHFVDRGPGKIGFFLEVPPVHPMLAAIVYPGTGASSQALMQRLPKMQAMLAIAVDGLLPEETGATVKLRKDGYGRHSIDYAFTPAHWEAFRTACKEMAKIQFAAGAKRVMSLHLEPVVMESAKEIDKLDAAPWERLRVKVVTAHQMGGCPMGADAATAVVDQRLRYFGLDNLYVVDGSVLPTGLGVNPQETIFGIARWAGNQIAGVL